MTLVVADIGSTFTKARAYDAAGELVWADQLPTAAEDLSARLRALASAAGIVVADRIPACSSAAGGLRIVSLGLTRTFTREAARVAALGAGGRIVGDHGFPLTETDLDADIVLLTGGSDGGDTDAAVGFAEALAALPRPVAVVVACNRQVAARCAELVTRAGHRAEVVANIMPDVGRLDVEPARAAIRRIFLDTVIGRLTSDRAGGFDIVAPTPAAVLDAAKLLCRTDGDRGTVVVDVGGATSDVHSVVAPGQVRSAMTEAATRTVEADLGMRESAEATGQAARRDGLPDGVAPAELARRARDVAMVEPDDPVDRWLARTCVALALRRHVGRLVMMPTAAGAEPVPVGRDLRSVGRVVATGGVLSRDAGLVTLDGPPDLLLPRQAVVSTDEHYELAAVGVLATVDAALAAKAMTRIVAGWDRQGESG